MSARPTLKELRVRARIFVREERRAWEDAKWQRLAAYLLDAGGGFVLGLLLGLQAGLSAVVWALTRVGA